MRFLLQYNPYSGRRKFSFFFMGSLRTTATSFFPLNTIPPPSSSRRVFHSSCKRSVSAFAFKPINNSHHPLPLKTKIKDFSSVPRPNYPDPVVLDTRQLEILKIKLKELGIDMHDCAPGKQHRLLCPMCKGGNSGEISLSLLIDPDGFSAVWMCLRRKCGWKGSTKALANHKLSQSSLKEFSKIKTVREISEDSLELEPICDVLRDYFAERLIKAETLKRNRVMQKRSGPGVAIAFTYWRSGKLVNCKYRDVTKKFWQEKGTEKVFYGLDDIEEASDIIIVEGEIDKLSMEEAGFLNCVSVPDGAPPSVSKYDVPPEAKDTKYQYLWNCKEYLQKASRIILATDGDRPGQSLAEELARRVGRERCWRVRWPKKNEVDHFKDANEVLMFLGPGALKEAVDNAELYAIGGLFNFRDYFNEIDAYYRRNEKKNQRH